MSLFGILVVVVALPGSLAIALNASSSGPNTTITSTSTVVSTSFLRATTTTGDSTPSTTISTNFLRATTTFLQATIKSTTMLVVLEGNCSGNDSRCSGSNQAACARLVAKGSDCGWMYGNGSEGSCLGNDSRCAGRGNQQCSQLASDGADCKWRAAFSFTGHLLLQVANATFFASNIDVQNAATLSIANITALPAEFLSVDLDASVGNQTRRLLTTRLLSIGGNVMLTYAGSVRGDAKPTATGEEVLAALMSATSEDFSLALQSNVDDTFGQDAFTVSVLEKSDVSLSLADSSITRTPTSTTAQVSEPPNSETKIPQEPERDNSAGLGGIILSHALVFAGVTCML